MNAASIRGATFPQIVLDTLRRFPAREAFCQDDLSLSYADVADDLARWASLLRQRGLRPGEGVGVLSPNRPEVWACQVAPTFVRGRYTALHPMGSFDDHLYQCDEAELRFLFVDPTFSERAVALMDASAAVEAVFSFGPAEGCEDLGPVLAAMPEEPLDSGPFYFKQPELTAETIVDGWLRSGDIATVNAEGFTTIVDRKKDMIVTGGFNVFPREVEDVLTTDPAVSQAAVIAVPDDKWGEAVKALIVAKPGQQVDPLRLIQLVKDRKGALAAPKAVEIVDDLPMTAVGKTDKKALRARYWGDTTRAVN